MRKDKIIIGEPRRIFFKRQNVVRVFYPLTLFAFFFLVLSFALPALAANTIGFSTMKKDAAPSLSQPNTSSHPKVVDYCSSFLNATLLEKGKSKTKQPFNPHRVVTRHIVEKNPVPIALSLYLGVRLAHGPQEMSSKESRQKFQKYSSKQSVKRGHPRALSIAAYRACKDEENLKRFYKNNKNI